MKLSDFDYKLPEELVAISPASPRDSSKLLYIDPDDKNFSLKDYHFTELPNILKAGDLLVFNDTKVIPARLLGVRVRGENRVFFEALLIKQHDYNLWEAFVKPAKRIKIGDILCFHKEDVIKLEETSRNNGESFLEGEVIDKKEDGIILIRFNYNDCTFEEAIMHFGKMPLPPYLLESRKKHNLYNKDEDIKDRDDYQTIFASNLGAIAAPTASLHFTPEIFQHLDNKGINHVFLTLHVGAGTFLPIKTEEIEHHKMHAEKGEISQEAANKIIAAKKEGRRIIAVGTTACRLLETASITGEIKSFLGDTDIFIRPGFNFKTVDGLITNFHQPKSTLLMLVSAFAGFDTIKKAYSHAIENRYRFYSYGDASLIFRK